MLKKKWNIKEVDLAKVDKISKEFSLPSPIAAIMSQRELSSKEETSTFFYPSKGSLHDPFLLMDMDIAVKIKELQY